MRRIVCIRIPHPQLAYWLRRHPEWQGRPVVVGGVPPARGIVETASKAARDAGVEPGMTLTQAQAIVPQAHFVAPDPAGMQQEWERLAVVLGRFSPLVELAAEPGVFYIDGHGMGRLYPTEREYAAHIRFTLQGENYQARVAVAGSRFAARAATALGDIQVVMPRREAQALAALPVEILPVSDALKEAFASLGVRTFRAVAEVPVEQLEARFGREGVAAARLVRGDDPTPLRLYQPPNLTAVEFALDGPVEGLEPVRFILKTVTDRLIGALSERGLACEEARLHLRLDDRTTALVSVVPATPTLSAPLLWELARQRLEREPLRAPIVHVRMEAVRVRPAAPDQKPLFVRSADHAKAELAVARLRGLLGDDAVLVPRRAAAYRPEKRIAWLVYHESPAEDKKKASPRRRPRGFYKPKDYGSALLPFPSPYASGPTDGLYGSKAHGSGAI